MEKHPIMGNHARITLSEEQAEAVCEWLCLELYGIRISKGRK